MARPLDDEPDLYPPEVERVTPEDREQRNRAIAGTTLVALGCGFILERLVGFDLDFIILSIGLGLLVGWTRVPRYAMFAFGAILTGLGLQDFFDSLAGFRFSSAIASLLAAAGFLAVYVRYPRRSWWALVGVVLFCAGAALDVGVGIVDWVSASVGLMPTALVLAGLMLLFRDRLPSPLVKTGLVVAGVVFALAALSNVGNGDGDGDDRPPTGATTTPTITTSERFDTSPTSEPPVATTTARSE